MLKLDFLKNAFPKDVRCAISSVVFSCTVMCLFIFILGGAVSGDEEHSIQMTCLEPYRASAVTGEALEAVMSPGTEKTRKELLARAIQSAVGDESYSVRVAVGAVLLNRERSSSFPASLSAVIRSAELYPVSFDTVIPERTYHAASDALDGIDPTFGALYVISTGDPSYAEYGDRVTAIYGKFAFLK